MKSNNEAPTQIAWTRPQVAVLWLFLVTLALLLNYGMDSTHSNFERQQRAESAYIVEHKCVIAQMSGRFPSMYRCDVPEAGRYISDEILAREALKMAEK